jgi:hypothetical protein
MIWLVWQVCPAAQLFWTTSQGDRGIQLMTWWTNAPVQASGAAAPK